MTPSIAHSALARPVGALSLRACACGLAASGALVGAALASGLLPSGTAAFVVLGYGVAALSGSAATWLLAWLSTTPKGHPQLTQRFVWGLVAPFLLQVAAAAAGCIALVLLQAKFAAIAAFGLSFAAAATALHTVGTLVVAQALRREGS